MSDKAIASCAFITLGSTFGSSIAPKEYCGSGEIPDFKLLLGTSITFMSLSILDNFVPRIATLFSISMALTAVMYFAVPVLNCFTNPNSKFCKECGPGSSPDTPAVAKGDSPTVAVPGIGDITFR